ncbi:squalene--hopene cyclase [Sciscionella sediminilitoris]|uniref:squalene--hopene cyclase n=1 Tax=Sciscionella sediminilitoris TaxID=1445613 RepID=UPI0004DF7F80|nr:squalene--hopene cyclase [Sciscionella sp. SE31]
MSYTVLDSELTTDEAEVTEALLRAREHLLSLQNEQGWWKGKLRTNVTMDAEDLFLRQFLGIRTEEQTEQTARWIRSQQAEDGTWATFPGGPAELSTTVEAYIALRLAGDDPQVRHMRLARDYILSQGGIPKTRIFTRFWLAMFGEWSWDDLPVLPPEMIFLPSWFPLNTYDWAAWARQTVMALTVVSAMRPVRSLGISITELYIDKPKRSIFALPKLPKLTELNPMRLVDARDKLRDDFFSTAFNGLDWLLHRHEDSPVKPLRESALRQVGEWIIARQEADGGWGGIQPPWVYSIIALTLLGYQMDHPVLDKAINGLDGFTVWEETPDGTMRWFEACQSPVWDTALALNALLDAGIPADNESVVTATDWLLAEQITVPGDWTVQRPGVECGGWAFEFANDIYPDTDDTSEIVLALNRVKHPQHQGAVRASIEKATTWLTAMRSKDGGWGAFDADNTQWLVNYVPFCDFGAVIDPPSADVTAHIVEMYAALGMTHSRPASDGLRWLLNSQEEDGSWYGRWGANYIYGTGAVVPALIKSGISAGDNRIRRAVAWLYEKQNPDGGWGEDLRSYVDTTWSGKGTSTPSQTAWALLALLAAGERGPKVDAGIRWLMSNQRADGGWDEEQFTGTGFPGDFYISYELYRLVFPINAIGRYLGTDQPA